MRFLRNFVLIFSFLALTISSAFAYTPYAVTSGAAKSRVESALVTCSSGGSSIPLQSSSWLSSIATRSGGCCAITVASNVFGSAPLCVATHSGTNTLAYFNVISSTTINLCGDNNGSVLNFSSYLMCQGARP